MAKKCALKPESPPRLRRSMITFRDATRINRTLANGNKIASVGCWNKPRDLRRDHPCASLYMLKGEVPGTEQGFAEPAGQGV
jgi:hypothetical protein